MATQYEFSKTDRNSIVRAYNNGQGMAAIAEEWSVSTPVIRRVLVEEGVAIRPVGRPTGS